MCQCRRISSVIGQGMEEKLLCFLLLPSNTCGIQYIANGGPTLTQRVKSYSAGENLHEYIQKQYVPGIWASNTKNPPTGNFQKVAHRSSGWG